MDQGIRRLLGGNSFILFFDGTGAARRLRRLRAYGATGHGGVAVADIAVATGKEPTLAEPEAWILNKLKEPERGARIVAVRRLKDLEPEIAVGIAAHILAQDDDPVVRGQAAAVLSKIGGDRAISVLDATLVDASDSVRRHAIRALGALGSDSAADALGRVLLEHPDRAERLMAIEALEGNASEAARSYLESARADRDAAVRQAIAVALDRRGRRAPVDTTKKATWKDSPNYRAGKLVK
jgi:HEAT repeat protein